MVSLSARALASALGSWRGLSASPAYAALADRIRLLVLDGRLALGTRLPAERALAAQHAIGLVARTLLPRGDRALVESPTYPPASESLRAHGARLVPVAVTTDEGWDELGLEQAIQRTSPTLGYLMPDFHNPTGR